MADRQPVANSKELQLKATSAHSTWIARARVVTKREGPIAASAYRADLVGYEFPQGFPESQSRKKIPSAELTERIRPLKISEQQSEADEWFTELLGPDESVQARLVQMGISAATVQRQRRSALNSEMRRSEQDEVRTLVQSGPPSNRIDLVFMGDGYTVRQADREKFFADVERLVADLFSEKTFSAYLPLFNVHAVYRASAEEGIGRGAAKDTAYGLYRPGRTLRAIYPTREGALRDSCAQAPDCDYPVVIANDDSYGGLGGEFAITTRASSSGTIVLRHELGHNFGDVGEEYDGGGYFGANHASTVKRLGWRDWLSSPDKKPVAADMKALTLGWPWASLTAQPFVETFRSAGGKQNMLLRMSMSGLGGPDAYRVTLNGAELVGPPLPSADRAFVDFDLPFGLSAGQHELKVEALQSDGDEYLSSFSFIEYGFDPVAQVDEVGAFPVFDANGKVAGFRPTNESCLMRNMMHPWFCKVCQENNWRRLLSPLDLVDDHFVGIDPNGARIVRIKTLALGQFREQGVPRTGSEHLAISWKVDGREIPEAADQTELVVSDGQARSVEATVRFESDSILKDETGFSRSVRRISLLQE